MRLKQLAMAFGCVGMMWGVGCTGDAAEAVDDTVVEPDLDARISTIARAACDRYEECELIGGDDDDAYGTRDECDNDMEAEFRKLWPASECSDRRIEATKYNECVSRTETYSCDMGVFEFLAFYDQCEAGDVCTDPAQ